MADMCLDFGNEEPKESPEYQSLANGFYKVRLVDIKEKKGNYDNDIVVFYLNVVEPSELSGFKLQSWLDKKTHPKSKLSQAVKAFMGKEYKGGNINLSTLIGCECGIEIQRDTHINKIVDFFMVNESEGESV